MEDRKVTSPEVNDSSRKYTQTNALWVQFTNKLILEEYEMKKNKTIIFNFIASNLLKNNDFDLKSDSKLIEQGLIDSFGIIQIISFIENEFSINLAQDDIKAVNFSSIDSIEKLLESYEKI